MTVRSRVIVYIDGFNLYFGLRQKGWRRYYWLNIRAFAEQLLLPDQDLVAAKYFTARISAPKDKKKRQSDFLEAVATEPKVEIHYGQYLEKTANCRHCGSPWKRFEEKMTDVNIATQMLTDAFEGNFDTAILVSADSDLVPPITAVKRLFNQKRMVVAFPPERRSSHLQAAADASFIVAAAKLAAAQFPDAVTKPDGHTLNRPQHWK